VPFAGALLAAFRVAAVLIGAALTAGEEGIAIADFAALALTGLTATAFFTRLTGGVPGVSAMVLKTPFQIQRDGHAGHRASWFKCIAAGYSSVAVTFSTIGIFCVRATPALPRGEALSKRSATSRPEGRPLRPQVQERS
jgi:hypothetical protein